MVTHGTMKQIKRHMYRNTALSSVKSASLATEEILYGVRASWFGTSPRLSQVLIDGVFFWGVARFRMCIGSGRRAASRLFRL